MELRDLKEQAGEHWSKGRFAQAEVLYRQASAGIDGLPFVLSWVRCAITSSEALRRLNRSPEAVFSYQRAGQVLADQGHFSKAVAAVRMALELKKDDIDLISELIRLEVRRKKGSKSSPSVEVAVVDHPRADLPQQLLALPMLPPSSAPIGVPVVPEVAVEPLAAGLETSQEHPIVMRLSDREVAIKSHPEARWMLVTADSPVLLRFVDSLPKPEH